MVSRRPNPTGDGREGLVGVSDGRKPLEDCAAPWNAASKSANAEAGGKFALEEEEEDDEEEEAEAVTDDEEEEEEEEEAEALPEATCAEGAMAASEFTIP